jgi:CelD/BcsL family acetyltransferase involved in cellulose biosynthesis
VSTTPAAPAHAAPVQATPAAPTHAAPAHAAPAVPVQAPAQRDCGAAWSTELLRDPAALDALAGEWDALVDRCAPATPFQCHAWLSSWWRSYGRSGRLRVLTVRRGDRLVAAAPLQLRRRMPPLLTPIGAGLTDFHDVLLDDEYADEAAAALAAALAGRLRLDRPWAALDLRELRPDAAALRLAGHWTGRTGRLPDSLCQHLPGVPVEQLLSRLPGRTAQRSRVKLRKLEAAGIEVREVPEPEVPQAVGALLGLHELQWRGRGVTPEHLSPRFRAHLTRAAERMVAADRATVREYRLQGELIACDLSLQGPGLAAIYVYGVHPDARDRVDVAGMLFRESLAQAAATGRPEVSLLRGDEPYKQRWRPEQVPNTRLLLGGAPAVALLRTRLRLRAAVLGALRTRAPWLAAVRTRLRTLRAGG